MDFFRNVRHSVFNNFSPYLYVSPENPVYLEAMRREQHNLRQRQQRIRNWSVSLVSCVGVIWLVYTLLMIFDPLRAEDYYRLFSTILIYAALATLADKLIVDFGVVNASLNVISDEIRNGRWELIAMSPLSSFDYVRGKIASQQWVSWHLVALSMLFRVVVMVCIFLHVFIMPFLLPSGNTSTPLTYFVRRMTANPPESVFIYLIYGASLLSAAVLYCVEPRWRLRVLTASAVALSARGQDATMTLLSGLLIIVRVWISQIFFAVIGLVMLLMFAWLSALFYRFLQSDLLVALGVPLYVYLLSAYIWAVYTGLNERSVKRAYQRLVQRGGTP